MLAGQSARRNWTASSKMSPRCLPGPAVWVASPELCHLAQASCKLLDAFSSRDPIRQINACHALQCLRAAAHPIACFSLLLVWHTVWQHLSCISNPRPEGILRCYKWTLAKCSAQGALVGRPAQACSTQVLHVSDVTCQNPSCRRSQGLGRTTVTHTRPCQSHSVHSCGRGGMQTASSPSTRQSTCC
jgi:hypothetical protein